MQNFFNRLMDMKIVEDSKSLVTFLDDSLFAKIKPKEVSNLNQVVA